MTDSNSFRQKNDYRPLELNLQNPVKGITRKESAHNLIYYAFFIILKFGSVLINSFLCLQMSRAKVLKLLYIFLYTLFIILTADENNLRPFLKAINLNCQDCFHHVHCPFWTQLVTSVNLSLNWVSLNNHLTNKGTLSIHHHMVYICHFIILYAMNFNILFIAH